MDNLIKTIKRLNEDDYKALLEQVSPNKFSKPYIVLETARKQDLSDSQMIDLLQVNPSTYYTLKSRLNSKVATILAKKVENPISVLLDEVTRVPATLYSTNKAVSIRALKELEKQLLEYDLSNELIIVYKTLARLHMYSQEYEHYNRQYNKFVAFSLAASKSENLFYDFIRSAGIHALTHSEQDLENMQNILRELANISELYDSHRLFVFFNITRIYYLCLTTDNLEGLQTKEMEIDKTLQEIRAIFNKYPLDTFYNNFKFIVDCLYFEYYQKVGYTVRAKHYYSMVNEQIPDLSEQHILSFHVVRFLEAKLYLFLQTGELNMLTDLNDRLPESFDVDKEEIYQYIFFQRFLAICKFYEGEFAASARLLNNLRNQVNLKAYWRLDVDVRLFQALQYALMGEEELCLQISNSISRYVREDKTGYKNIKAFIKLLKATMKSSEENKKAKKIQVLWETFLSRNHGPDKVLDYVKLDNTHFNRLSNEGRR